MPRYVNNLARSPSPRADIPSDNSAGPKYQTVTVRGVRPDSGQDVMTEETRSLVVPAATQTFTYDDDGNLTSDGIWNYTWDAENRLVSMIATGRKKLDFEYDYLGRRVQKDVYTWTGSWGTPVTTKFIYDGWNLLAELDSANAVIRSYMWGLDLSGSEQALVASADC